MRERQILWLAFVGTATTAARLVAWALRRTDTAALPVEWPVRERRVQAERRSGRDRRAHGGERSLGARIGEAADRRSGVDQRSGVDRRRNAA